MFDLPLHPVVVHFPIVLGMILPFVGLLFWWCIKKEYVQQKVWILVTALALVYGASALVAVELGEKDEDKVEKVVSEKVIEQHEEAGEKIPWIAGALFLVSLAGLLRRNSHSVRLTLGILALFAIIPLADTGHTGGKLVYHYGAANAHLPDKYKASIKNAKLIGENENFKLTESEDEKDDDEDDDD